MSGYVGVLLQIILLLAVLGGGSYFFLTKVKKNQFKRFGQNGKMSVEDGLMLNNQTSAYLMKVDGQQALVVVGQSGIDTTILREKRFQELMEESIEEATDDES